jgi:hypothetical protein
MAFNGSGTFDRPVSDYVFDTVISETDMNSEMDGIATALSTAICKDGQTTTTARIPFASGISSDTIAELSSATGVTVDGVLLKDGRIDTTQGADISSASTVNLETATGNVVDVTGTTTITAITLSQGHFRWVRFTGILTLTHSSSLVLPGAANITTAAGDYALFIGYGSSVVRCADYIKASGVALPDPMTTRGDIIVRNSSNVTARLGIGSAGTALYSDGTDASWTGIHKQGLQTVWIPATAMIARTTNGAAAGTTEMSSNKNMVKTLDFDASTQEFAQFEIRFPKNWNRSTITFIPLWSHASTTTNFGVVWALQAVARSDDDTLDVAFGTEQTSTDTGGTTNDLYVGPTSSAITVGGTPAVGDSVQFQIKRNVSDGSDTMAVDARLHGVVVLFTTNAADDT